MKLLAILMIIFSIASHAKDNKEGGNGQLVIVPEGHSKPVPYEAVVAWEVGKYRNFFKLPCVDGNVEKRKKFNRDYGCSAQKWLNMVKDVSPGLYRDLIHVAKTTHFHIVNHHIQWEHKPYPEGELDYKKYEKAAFYNGEIILSTKVMDRIGPLADVLNQEDNQGYVVFHELINALYPDKSVKWKLDLGEVFLQKKIFRHSREETLLNLALIDLSYLESEKNYDLLLRVLAEYKLVRPHMGDYKLLTLNGTIFTVNNYMKTGLAPRDALVAYLGDTSKCCGLARSDRLLKFLRTF